MTNCVLGKSGRDLLERARLAEADHYNGGLPVLGELAHRLLALRIVLDLEVAEGDAGVFLELLGAVEGAPR